jgi:hypothetical protein
LRATTPLSVTFNNGSVFLVVTSYGTTGHQAGSDLIVRLNNAEHLDHISDANFAVLADRPPFEGRWKFWPPAPFIQQMVTFVELALSLGLLAGALSMSDGKTEYHLLYTRGAAPQDEVFASEMAALGRACTVMQQRSNHDFCICNATGKVVHTQTSLVHTSRLLRGKVSA